MRSIGLGDAGGFSLTLLGWFQPSGTHGLFHMYLLFCQHLLLFTAPHFKSNLNLIEVPTLNGFLPEIYKLTLSLETRHYLLVSELHGRSGKVWQGLGPSKAVYIHFEKDSFLGKYQLSHWEQHLGQGSFLHPTWRWDFSSAVLPAPSGPMNFLSLALWLHNFCGRLEELVCSLHLRHFLEIHLQIKSRRTKLSSSLLSMALTIT